VVDTLRSSDWVPRSVRRKVDLLNINRNRLKEGLGRLPSREEMANHMEIDVKKYDAMVQDAQIRSLLSLDAPVGEENPTPMIEQIAGDDDVQGYWLNEELKEGVLGAMQQLPEREKTALALYYLHDLSLKEVGKVLGVTESRSCQLCSQGIKRLRKRLRHLLE
jgi:RNA polymerase sigma factor for flagellar operon FliA